MDFADMTNGLFEALGAIAIFGHVRRVLKDKAVAGVSILSVVFFAAWGFWNLYYYPHLDQWLSFAGGVAIVLGNVCWITGMLYYTRHPKKEAVVDLGCSPPPRCEKCRTQLGDMVRVASANVTLRQLRTALKLYITALEDECGSLTIIASNHGFQSSHVIEGENLRNTISVLEKELEAA